jgi:hypothetical protein
MDQLPALGTEIDQILVPTWKTYEGLLKSNRKAIESTQMETFSYGEHPRQELDLYVPKDNVKNAPILIFVHGGGLVQGGKSLESIEKGLAYNSLGYYFTEQHGYLTIIMNYRLVNSHGAVFPTGGEDIEKVVKWLSKHFEGETHDLFIMGNSAGGIHTSTFTFYPKFAETIKNITKPEGIRYRGQILLGLPAGFKHSAPSRAGVLKTYYGDSVDENSPIGLLKSMDEAHWELLDVGRIKTLVAVAELEPNGEVLEPNREFVATWKEIRQDKAQSELYELHIKSHNHISPPLSLGTAKDEEELWGAEVVQWMDDIKAA